MGELKPLAPRRVRYPGGTTINAAGAGVGRRIVKRRAAGRTGHYQGQHLMATMFCALCNRPVEAKRQIGAGTIILAVVTGGLWLVTIPFYSKRCSICKSSAVSASLPGAAPANVLARVSGLEERLRLKEGELDMTRDQLDRVRSERDFYRDLLGDRVHDRDHSR